MSVVLVVDDSAMTRNFTAKFARNAGHETLQAENGRQGLEMIENQQPDCVILDLLMPDLTGFEVLEELKTRNSSIPVVVLTADIQESTRVKCTALGAFAVLNKPPKEEPIREVIESALRATTETSPCE